MVRDGAAIDFTALPWDGPLSVVLHVDALSAMFALMGTGLGLIVLYYSIDYMAKDPAATRFYALMLTFICGMVGLVYSSNLFVFYLCWEVWASAPSAWSASGIRTRKQSQDLARSC